MSDAGTRVPSWSRRLTLASQLGEPAYLPHEIQQLGWGESWCASELFIETIWLEGQTPYDLRWSELNAGALSCRREGVGLIGPPSQAWTWFFTIQHSRREIVPGYVSADSPARARSIPAARVIADILFERGHTPVLYGVIE